MPKRATRVYVKRSPRESFDHLLSRFNKAVERENVLTLVREGARFEKPSTARRRKAHLKLLKSRQSTQRDIQRNKEE